MRYFSLVLTFVIISLITSCQNSNNAIYASNIDIRSLYLDQKFQSTSVIHIETEHEIFMLDDEMISLVENKLINDLSTKQKVRVLLEHIFSQENIALTYSSNANVTARDAFHNQAANCMSLTIMAYALAKEAGLNAKFQQVDIPEYWVRNGQYNLLTGHVNLIIEPQVNPEKNIVYGSNAIQIDFDPYILKQQFRKKVIKKNTVLAMFYNNKGSQALVDRNYSVAYQYFKSATLTDPNFSSAWGNLAVLYRLTNNAIVAEKTYRHAINLNSNNLTALANLAILLRATSHIKEANKIDTELALKRNRNPYYHAVIADELFYQGNYEQALHSYKKAIRLDDNLHELYFGLAKVYYQMNKIAAAKKAMRTALKLNKTKSTEYQYIAKLNFLKMKSKASFKKKS